MCKISSLLTKKERIVPFAKETPYILGPTIIDNQVIFGVIFHHIFTGTSSKHYPTKFATLSLP